MQPYSQLPKFSLCFLMLTVNKYHYSKPAHWPVGRVFAYDPGDLDSIPGCVIPKTLKMVLDTSLLNTQQYKVRIKGKVEQSKERSCSFPSPWCSSS